MLVTKSGFKVFNEYDLSQTLEAQILKLQEEVKSLVQLEKNEAVPALAEKYKLTSLSFDIQNLTLETKSANIPAEYFPNGFFVERGKSYTKDVLVFYLPFIGDTTLLRCVPSPRILWTEEIAVEGNNVVFELIKFTDNAEAICRERDRIINFFTTQAGYINNQIEQYNNSISRIISEAESHTRSQISKHREFLAQLGTPTRKSQPIQPSTNTNYSHPSRVTEKKEKNFDVFICHASEDKNFVNQLANSLKEAEISVWYDAFQIGWGDDLRPAIDDGLKKSRFGLVIFSKAFLGKKKWTEYELNGLFSKEKEGKKIILPIWHNITKEDIAEYSPTFADRIAKRSDDILVIVKELKEILK